MYNPKHRYSFSFFFTVLLYVVPVTLYLGWKSELLSPQLAQPKEQVMTLSLASFAPQPAPVSEEAPVQKEILSEAEESNPEPPKEEEVEEKPKEEEAPQEPPKEEPAPPKEEPKPLPTPKPAPVPKKKKPNPKPVKKVQKHTPKKTHTKTKKRTQKKKYTRKRVVSGGGKPHYSAAQKNQFLAQIRARINRAKSYPRVAQRRGMQGVVKARFTILPNGRVSAISLSGPRVFHRSAKKAIESAFPVQASKAPMKLPATVTLSLRYRLH